MQAVTQSADEFKLEYIICPKCNCLVDASKAKAIFEPYSGIVLGFMLYCDSPCLGVSFINLLSKPPLFDLSERYSIFNRTGD